MLEERLAFVRDVLELCPKDDHLHIVIAKSCEMQLLSGRDLTDSQLALLNLIRRRLIQQHEMQLNAI